MQTYGQNNTPQQQAFNRFQPQQPQQYGNFGPQGGYGRGFMPQNRGGYERQMDNLRGGYNRPMPPMMQNNPQAPQPDAAYNTYMQSLPEYAQRQDLQKQMEALSVKMQADPQGTTMRNALQANARQIMPQQDMGYGGGYGRFNIDRGQQQSPEEYARQRGYAYDPQPTRGNQTWDQFQLTQGGGQPATGYEARPSLGGQQIPYSPSMDAGFGDPRGFNFGATPAPNTQLSGALAAGLGQPNAPAGGKGGNPTATGSGVSDSRYA
jgi:hypothetical protein